MTFTDMASKDAMSACAKAMIKANQDFMQPDTTYAMSDKVHSCKGTSLPIHAGFNRLRQAAGDAMDSNAVDERKRETASRFETLRRRMHTLQLAQLVLEDCDEDIAETIHALLMCAKKTGGLPLRAEFNIGLMAPDTCEEYPSQSAH